MDMDLSDSLCLCSRQTASRSATFGQWEGGAPCCIILPPGANDKVTPLGTKYYKKALT